MVPQARSKIPILEQKNRPKIRFGVFAILFRDIPLVFRDTPRMFRGARESPTGPRVSRDNVWNIYSKISKIKFHDFSKFSDSIFFDFGGICDFLCSKHDWQWGVRLEA